MRRYKARWRPVCGGSWVGAEPLLRPRPGPFGGEEAQRLQGRQEQELRGRTAGPQAPAQGSRRWCPGRLRGPGLSSRSEPAPEHRRSSGRAATQDPRNRGACRASGGPRRGLEGKEGRMSKNSLHRHYDRLTPEERFRLDVLAMARGDEVESERLVGSCPRFSYTMNDRGFAGRWQGAIEITLRVYIPLGEQLAKLQLVDAFREMIPYSQSLLSNIAFDAYFDGH